MGRKCKTVVDSGAQVTEINNECFKECMMGKQSRPVRSKGVAEYNSLMAEVVDDVEIELGIFQRRIEFLWLIFLMNVSLGWIQCKCLKWLWMSGRAWWE